MPDLSTSPETFVTHLESALDGTRLPADSLQTLHRDRPLWVRYDLEAIRGSCTRDQLRDRPPGMWRYRELLPPRSSDSIISLGEGPSPLIRCPRLGAQLGLRDLWIKDEGQLPTGSFKSRGMAMAITMAQRFGVQRVALPSAGNAGGAAAAYAARAGMECFVFMPEDTPIVNQYEAVLAGAHTFRVNGLINDCGRIVREGQERMQWFDLSTLKEPYRIEGKKTMGLELAEQCDWQLPDVILYPTGGGTGLIGMWKAFAELGALGWLEGNTRPRMISVQSDGCAPIARAFQAGERFAEPFAGAETIARGLRVPAAVGDFMILDAVRESGGCALAVEEARITDWMRQAVTAEGISVCPETGACIGALEQLIADGQVGPDERVVVFNTGAAQKYVEAITTTLPHIDLSQEIAWNDIEP
ncbi:MAG: threonine synthase [Planctomycetaceae bacterium]|nr:threonine synthase [Planctomycetaceae bacterium]